jgi:hypothetical protein
MGAEQRSREGPPEPGGSWLQIITQVAGLLAGLATVVYLAGGVVLALRLAFVGLPWGDVVSQLPRQFLISIGTGQVLFPALLVGALYALSRLLRAGRAQLPSPHRWRDGANTRLLTVQEYLRVWGVLALPLAFILLTRGLHFDFEWVTWKAVTVIAVGLLVLAVTAIAVQETRAAVIQTVQSSLHWEGWRMVAVMAGLYVAAAIPAMMAAAASVPLSAAKICDEDNFAEHGFLVGETTDRVYLGEEASGHPRRIAVIPFAKVGELFIGHDADEADCEVVSAPPSAAERRDAKLRLRVPSSSPRYLIPPGTTLRSHRAHGHNPPDEADGGDSLRRPGNQAP